MKRVLLVFEKNVTRVFDISLPKMKLAAYLGLFFGEE